jgi:hypothetical protein
MPTDAWLIFAYFMIFSSVILCGLLPMIFHLLNARQSFYRYNLERLEIISDINQQNFQRIDSHEQSITYAQIPFIDHDDISV